MEQPYKSEPKPYLRMEAWDKFNLQVVFHPILRRFPKRHRYNVLAVLALSMSFENIGVINQYDDEIAHSLEMNLAGWMRLQPLLILHHVLRETTRPSGRRVYEINPLLLVKQAGDQRSPQAFDPQTWDNAALPIETFDGVPERSDIERLIPDTLTPEERKKARGAARTALSRYLETCRKSGQPPMSQDEFKLDYFSKRFGSPSGFDSEEVPQTPEECNAPASDPVTPDGNGNTPPIPENQEFLSQTTTTTGNSNASEPSNSVTEKLGVTVTENGGGGGNVAHFFSELGVFEEIVEKHSGYIPSVEYAEMFVDYCNSIKTKPDVLPLIGTLMEKQRTVPKPFAEQWKKTRREEQERLAKSVQSQDKQKTLRAEQDHLDQLYALMEGDEKFAFDRRVETLLEGDPANHLRWKRDPHTQLAKTAWRKYVHAALREDGFPLQGGLGNG